MIKITAEHIAKGHDSWLLPDENWLLGYGTGQLYCVYKVIDMDDVAYIAGEPLERFIRAIRLVQDDCFNKNIDNLYHATTDCLTDGAVLSKDPNIDSAFWSGFAHAISHHPRLWDGRLLAMDVRLVPTPAFLSASGYTSAEWKSITRAEVLPVSTFQRVRTACRTLLKSV